MTEEEEFAVMIREVLTEYDFSAVEILPSKAWVSLTREIFADDGKQDVVEHTFTEPVLVKTLIALRRYLPAL